MFVRVILNLYTCNVNMISHNVVYYHAEHSVLWWLNQILTVVIGTLEELGEYLLPPDLICDSWLVGGEVKESWEYAFCLFILLQLLIDKVLASKLGLGQRILEEGLVGGGAGSPLVSTAVGVNAYTWQHDSLYLRFQFFRSLLQSSI